ncbi:MAG TPA: Holliday junction branch migration protein RuvA [Candidatus Binatia bacterium]|nr:Holliday junction branch migration protein RuvA [Candidatus Binatia bacterium]
MIAKISGILAHKEPGEVIVDVGGVGYHIFIPLSVFYRLPELGKGVSLHVHTHLREDSLQLFGFLEPEEKRLFLLLNGVTGIGPKLAVNILSGIPSEDLARALQAGDQMRLLAIPGVGRKLADRMIVELKDKFLARLSEEKSQGNGSQLMVDAVSALVNLGYHHGEAEKIVREIAQNGEPKLPEVLKEALRRLSH